MLVAFDWGVDHKRSQEFKCHIFFFIERINLVGKGTCIFKVGDIWNTELSRDWRFWRFWRFWRLVLKVPPASLKKGLLLYLRGEKKRPGWKQCVCPVQHRDPHLLPRPAPTSGNHHLFFWRRNISVCFSKRI